MSELEEARAELATVKRNWRSLSGRLEKARKEIDGRRRHADRLRAERDYWKDEHEQLTAQWAILAERTLIASVVAEEAPDDVEDFLEPIRLELLRKILAGQAGRDDLTAKLLPRLAEAERRYAEHTDAELARARRRARQAEATLAVLQAAVDQAREIAEKTPLRHMRSRLRIALTVPTGDAHTRAERALDALDAIRIRGGRP